MSKPFSEAYRPDIDGMRALAIILVLIFHGFPRLLPAGYVGVDVFFVISGFLITQHIWRDLQLDTFRFANFYARRIRRLLPALGLMLISVWAFGWWVLTPEEFRALGKHLLGTAFFFDNILLYRESGYFDRLADLKPLLHMWSLSLEEQFYLLWPLTLVGLFRKKLPLVRSLFIIMLVSYALSCGLTYLDREASFYLLPTRIWQFLAGSLCSFATPQLKAWIQRKSPLVSLLALGLLAVALASIDSLTFYPGWIALLPTVAACLLILIGPQGYFNRTVLSHPWALFIGKISYPLYLWHWPLLAFPYVIDGAPLDTSNTCLVLLFSFFLAWITQRFVEQRVQLHLLRLNRTRDRLVLTCGLLLVAVLGLGGLTTFLKLGFPIRWTQYENFAQDLEWKNFGTFECNKMLGLASDIYCFASSQKPKVLLWGDSHAGHLQPGLQDTLNDEGIAILHTGKGNCPPLLMVERYNGKVSNGCYQENAAISELLTKLKDVQAVILSFQVPWEFQNLGAESRWRFSSKVPEERDLTQEDMVEQALERSLRFIASLGKKTILALDVPDLGYDPQTCIRTRPFYIGRRSLNSCTVPKDHVLKAQETYRAIVSRLHERNPSVEIFDPLQFLCDDQTCYGRTEEGLRYRDSNHLSVRGSRVLGAPLLSIVRDLISVDYAHL